VRDREQHALEEFACRRAAGGSPRTRVTVGRNRSERSPKPGCCVGGLRRAGRPAAAAAVSQHHRPTDDVTLECAWWQRASTVLALAAIAGAACSSRPCTRNSPRTATTQPRSSSSSASGR
jgi:hypothetical protein